MADSRRMCSNCRAFIGAKDKVCEYCGHTVAPRAIDLRMPDDLLGGLVPARRAATSVLLLANVGLYLATVVVSMQSGNEGAFMNLDSRTLIIFGGMYREGIAAGDWWRLITAGYLHGGILHIGMNMWAMMDIGPQVEEMFGTPRTIAIWTAATILGFFLSFYFGTRLSIGASAGLFGLIGAMIAVGTLHKTAMAQAIKAAYVRMAIYGIVIGLLGFLPIDNAAHIGGLAGGFGVAWLAGLEVRDGGMRDRIWRSVGVGCVVLTLLAFVLMAMAVPK
ncbi:MAG: rhomboid family intramembrane serine protease [Acidobacteriota bacterium]